MARALLIPVPMSTAIAPPTAAGARAARRIAALCAQGREFAAAYVEEPGEAEPRRRLREFRRVAATVVAGLPATARGGPEFAAVAQLRQVLADTGADDRPVEAADLALARELGSRGWSPGHDWHLAQEGDKFAVWVRR